MLTLLLTLAMVVSMSPVTALADEQTSAVTDEITTDATMLQEISTEIILDTFNIELGEIAGSAEESEVLGLESLDSTAAVGLGEADLSSDRSLGDREAEDLNRPRPRSGDFYFSVQGHFTQAGQDRPYQLDLFPGEMIQIQMDLPNSANIDYDLYLYRLVGNNLVFVGGSAFRTLINGTNGTMPEYTGWFNNTGTTQRMVIFTESFRGGSSTMPYTLHFGINSRRDSFEVDAPFSSIVPVPQITANQSISIDVRQFNTRVDNDWYSFTSPAGVNQVQFILDSTSRNRGHRVELYTMSNNQARRVNMDSQGVASVVPGTTYIVRAYTNLQPISGTNYTLEITPVLASLATSATITQRVNFNSPVLRQFGELREVQGGRGVAIHGRATANGSPASNATVTVGVWNPAWGGMNDQFATGSQQVQTDVNGNFIATFAVPSCMGLYSFYNGFSNTIFDLGYLFVMNEAGQFIYHTSHGNYELIYIRGFSN